MIDLKLVSDEILKQVDIVEIISHYIKVEKKGRNYTSLCPFHDDKKLGNFYISPDKQIFKCFSCGKSGNAINFVQYKENINYIEALRKVCEIAGIEDNRLGKKEIKVIDQELDSIYKCLTDINNFYSVSLFQSEEGKQALEYLYNRGLSEEIIKHFDIGYSQNDGQNLINYLKNKGYSIKTISETGITHLDTNGPLKDNNAGRITFSIKNKENQVVGFSARIFGNNKSDSKYINTRETKAFNKSSILYNFGNVINEVKKVGYVYVLEGFMDVIAAYRVGITSAVALMGTAFTKQQLQLLRYLKVEIRLCLDLDEPGQDNMKNIINVLDQNDLKFLLVNNNQQIIGKDSDDILHNNGDKGLIKFLNNLISKGEWLINYYSKSLNLNSLNGRKLLLNNFIPVLAETKNRLDYEDYLNRISKLTLFNKETIDKLVLSYRKTKEDGENLDFQQWSDQNGYNKKYLTKLEFAERQVMRYILENKEAFNQYELKIGYLTDDVYRNIVNLIDEYLEKYVGENYSVKDLISFLNSSEDEKVLKNEMIDVMTTITLDKSWYCPPYTEQTFNELVSTINMERENTRNKQAYKDAIRGKDNEETAKHALNYLNKKSDMIDKK